MTPPPQTKRFYGSKQSQQAEPPSSPSSHTSSSPLFGTKRKRLQLDPLPSQKLSPLPRLPKKRKTDDTATAEGKQKKLTQLHFCIDQTTLKTCPLCDLSYTKGAPDDEALHRSHCARVRRGMEWGREEEKETVKYNVREVATDVKLKNGQKGRIICFNADAGGKLGSKLSALLGTINRTLCSPPLTSEALKTSKAYLFLMPPNPPSSIREKIVGCVIAQQIETAMAIATSEEVARLQTDENEAPLTDSLVAVDTTTGLFCHPKPLRTPLGIPRLFVPSEHRRQGIASHLLTAAAGTFYHGCRLDPHLGQVAFTQPTGDGNAVMRHWGGGGVRIYEG
ncbi:hypothetical protein AX16_003754 [Volvariella volvacea WC 439]|nr:hypothetical protein AX16_003754 [Volvariella volvacea WC 439]